MIDLHSHILPGVDDGPLTEPGALALARAAVADGTTTMVATPHVDHAHAVAPAAIAHAVTALRGALEREGIPLDIQSGAEISIGRVGELSDADLDQVRLGGGPYVLLESPLSPGSAPLEHYVFDLQLRGFGVVLAHPERTPAFQEDLEALERLIEHGALCQITAASLLGRFGIEVRRLTVWLLREGLVHVVASDAHDVQRRPPELSSALRLGERDVPGLSTQAAWLTDGMPGAILAGGPLPPRPVLPRSRWRSLLGR